MLFSVFPELNMLNRFVKNCLIFKWKNGCDRMNEMLMVRRVWGCVGLLFVCYESSIHRWKRYYSKSLLSAMFHRWISNRIWYHVVLFKFIFLLFSYSLYEGHHFIFEFAIQCLIIIKFPTYMQSPKRIPKLFGNESLATPIYWLWYIAYPKFNEFTSHLWIEHTSSCYFSNRLENPL